MPNLYVVDDWYCFDNSSSEYEFIAKKQEMKKV